MVDNACIVDLPQKRVSVDGMDAILGHQFPVLDKGFVRLIDYMGDDAAIVQAARVSYGKGTKKTSEDAALINYLIRHRHTTPFEMCEIKLHVKLPIFVARQWIRHRTANVNEYSARYSVVENDFYIPNRNDVAYQSKNNAQGRSEVAPAEIVDAFLEALSEDCDRCAEHYGDSINAGIAREIARINLPVNCYTQWYWKIDLHNLLNFLRLRARPNAQFEIREYANTILEEILKVWVPMVYDAFMNYSFNGYDLSRKELQVVRGMLKGEKVDQVASGLTEREWKGLMEVLQLRQD